MVLLMALPFRLLPFWVPRPATCPARFRCLTIERERVYKIKMREVNKEEAMRVNMLNRNPLDLQAQNVPDDEVTLGSMTKLLPL